MRCVKKLVRVSFESGMDKNEVASIFGLGGEMGEGDLRGVFGEELFDGLEAGGELQGGDGDWFV